MPTPVKGEAAQIRLRLTFERAKLDTLSEKSATARRSSAVTPGGLDGDFDHGVLTRPRASHRAQSRRYAAYDREAAASRALTEQQGLVARLERQLERAEADAQPPCDLTSLKPGSLVRDRWGWHRVVRVSKKSVSVETGYSWTERILTERILLDRLIEIRNPQLQKDTKDKEATT